MTTRESPAVRASLRAATRILSGQPTPGRAPYVALALAMGLLVLLTVGCVAANPDYVSALGASQGARDAVCALDADCAGGEVCRRGACVGAVEAPDLGTAPDLIFEGDFGHVGCYTEGEGPCRDSRDCCGWGIGIDSYDGGVRHISLNCENVPYSYNADLGSNELTPRNHICVP